MSTISTLVGYGVIVAFVFVCIFAMNYISHLILLRAQNKRNDKLDRELLERQAELDRLAGIGGDDE